MAELLAPADFVALALELEKEGQYNTAKLLRGAAIGVLNREAHTRTVPSDPVDQAELLESLALRLTGTHVGELAEPLRVAAGAVREGRVALEAEAPDPYVCRTCGDLGLGSYDARCTHCGRWPSTVERIRPIYWQRESSSVEAIERLRANRVAVVRLVGDGTDARLRSPGADGGWSAHQVLEHLHNAQSVFRGRIDQLVAGGGPTLESVMVWAIEGGDATTRELVRAYGDMRSEILDLLGALHRDAWWHKGHHEEWGWVTLAEQASYFANHEPTHLGQLEDAVGSA